MTLWELKILEEYYDLILEGEKCIEVRAPELSGEFQYDIEKGDALKFYYNDDKDPSVCFEAEGLKYYESPDALLDEEEFQDIVPQAESRKEAMKEFDELPGNYTKRIDEQGLYAIKIGERIGPQI